MDLVIVNKQKHVHYILPIIIFFSTIILSYAKIQETALPFLLPLFIVSFYSGYLYLTCFLTAIIGISIINQDTFTIVVIITLLLTIYLLNFTHLLKTKYISFIITAILIPFFYANHYNILQTTVLVMLTLFNCYLDQEIIPLIIHQNKNVLNIKRLQALIVVVCTLFISFIPFNTTYTMIFLRYFLLISIYYLSIEKVMPIILYLSILLMLIAPSLKDDVLSLILPMSFFFMMQPKNKYLFISIFLLSHITLPFFINYNYFYYAFVILVPVFLFMISPQFKNKKIKINPEFIEISYQEQLKSKADAFASLFHQLTEVFKEENQETHLSEYVGYVYEDVCHHCSSKKYCFYSQEGMSRLGKLISKGIQKDLEVDDYNYIYQHCLKPDDYLKSLKNHQKGYFKMLKVNHAHDHLKKDYENYMLEIGIEDIDEKTVTEELIPILENYLNESLDLVSIKKQHLQIGYTSILLKHELKYTLQLAKKQYALDQQCGDSILTFGLDEHHYVALSDGMGQGYIAYKESKLTLDVLSQLLKNGIQLRDTLNTLNTLLKIKNQGDMYTTLDLFDFNLMNSRLKVIKYGAYESYLIRNHQIDVLHSHSLPVGMASTMKMVSYDMKIKENDILILTSDGVGEHFFDLLKKYQEEIEKMSVYEIVSFLFQKSFQKKDLDDMSIIVIKVVNRN